MAGVSPLHFIPTSLPLQWDTYQPVFDSAAGRPRDRRSLCWRTACTLVFARTMPSAGDVPVVLHWRKQQPLGAIQGACY